MGVRDLGLERERSQLWISNHPRFHGSAWKVPALDIEPSTISRFSVEGPRSGYRTIHDIMVQRGRSPLWISNHPRYHGSARKVPALDIEPSTISRFSVEGPRPEAVTKRAERANGGTRAACFEQPEGVHSGCGDAKPAMFTSCYSIYIHPRYEA